MHGLFTHITFDDCPCVSSKGDVVEYFETLYYGVHFRLLMNG